MAQGLPNFRYEQTGGLREATNGRWGAIITGIYVVQTLTSKPVLRAIPINHLLCKAPSECGREFENALDKARWNLPAKTGFGERPCGIACFAPSPIAPQKLGG